MLLENVFFLQKETASCVCFKEKMGKKEGAFIIIKLHTPPPPPKKGKERERKGKKQRILLVL